MPAIKDPFARPSKSSGIADCVKGFLFGADPELFVLNESGRPVTAAGLIPGTKEEPHKVKDGAVQVDGMAAEFNIDPCSSFEEFDGRIQSVLSQLTKMLPNGHTLTAVPSIRFAEEDFKMAPDEAKVLGCNPDFNAWTGKVNPPPHDAENPYLRTASGHIHIGWADGLDVTDPQHVINCCDLIKQLDWYLGGWSLRKDTDATRRLLYGKAGAYRPKPYGVEYRVLSNFWISNTESRLEVWNRLQRGVNNMQREFIPDGVHPSENEMLVDAINTSKPNSHLEGAYRFPLLGIGSFNSGPPRGSCARRLEELAAAAHHQAALVQPMAIDLMPDPINWVAMPAPPVAQVMPNPFDQEF